MQVRIETGSSLYAKDPPTGLTSLSLAVLMEHGPVVKRLLGDNRADWYCKDNSGDTPLWLAISGEKTEIVRLLLESGVRINAPIDIVSKHDCGKTQCHKRLTLPPLCTIGRK